MVNASSRKVGRLKLIEINGQLEVAGTNARMKRLLAKIHQTEDRKLLRLLSRAWWFEYFKLNPKEKAIGKAA